MSDLSQYLKKSLDLKQKREEREKEAAKDRLLRVATKKVQTTMIGAISTIEKCLDFLWDDDNPTPEQEKLRNIFEEMRSEILDRGNTQIRNLENEFQNYDVTFKRYTISLPIKER